MIKQNKIVCCMVVLWGSDGICTTTQLVVDRQKGARLLQKQTDRQIDRQNVSRYLLYAAIPLFDYQIIIKIGVQNNNFYWFLLYEQAQYILHFIYQ